jgi:hypothetical protein
MKPLLLLAFLVLMPALADHLPVTPPASTHPLLTPVARAGVSPASDRVAHAQLEMTADERARFCGRGS